MVWLEISPNVTHGCIRKIGDNNAWTPFSSKVTTKLKSISIFISYHFTTSLPLPSKLLSLPKKRPRGIVHNPTPLCFFLLLCVKNCSNLKPFANSSTKCHEAKTHESNCKRISLCLSWHLAYLWHKGILITKLLPSHREHIIHLVPKKWTPNSVRRFFALFGSLPNLST